VKRAHPATAAAKRHMGRVSELPCCLCGVGRVHVHHILQGRTPGVRSPDWLTIPVCDDCHQGERNGIHGQQVMLKVSKTTEHQLLNDTLEALYGARP
jgi:hypothetical protein